MSHDASLMTSVMTPSEAEICPAPLAYPPHPSRQLLSSAFIAIWFLLLERPNDLAPTAVFLHGEMPWRSIMLALNSHRLNALLEEFINTCHLDNLSPWPEPVHPYPQHMLRTGRVGCFSHWQVTLNGTQQNCKGQKQSPVLLTKAEEISWD